MRKWATTVASVLLTTVIIGTTPTHAKEPISMEDESIYDLLVDRYFNGSIENDLNANPKDNTQFAGGDFKGLIEKSSLITDMNFSIVSIGNVFATEKYDGSSVTSYEQIEEHFGNEEEFKKVIKTFASKDVKVMVDFPLTNVSENHEWTLDTDKSEWIINKNNGTVQWDLSNEKVQDSLTDAIVDFISTYEVGAIRLTNIETADSGFLNNLIKAIKEVKNDIYVISNEDSNANFDAHYSNKTNETFRTAFQGVDKDTANILNDVELYLQGKQAPPQLMIDTINSDRFTLTAESYPPTRVKIAIASTLLLPGVPVMQYGTEIVMNGEAGRDAHQVYNFKTDTEIIDFIKNIQTLKNQSNTLKNGDFKLIKNEKGLLVFERSSENETWIIAINNTSKTSRVDISAEDIGYDKELHGMFERETIRGNEEGFYPIVLDREMVEIFQVTEKKGINISYAVALGLVYILFIGFIIVIVKRGKRRRREEA